MCPASSSAEDGLSGLVARYGDLVRRKSDLDDAIRELESRINDAWPEGEHTVHSRRFALTRLEEDGMVSFRLVEDGSRDNGLDASS